MAREEARQTEQIWMALGAFALLAVVGPVLGWSNGDLLWGLLVTSLVACIIGAVLGVTSLWRLGWRGLPQRDHWQRLRFLAVTPFLGLFCLVLVGICYGFHTLYGLVIYFLYPLWPEIESSFDLADRQQGLLMLRAAGRYWPFVAATLVADWRELFRPLAEPQPLDIARVWTLLFRMHFFLMIAITVVVVAGTGYVLYLLILLFFFFPWRLVVRNVYRRRAGAG